MIVGFSWKNAKGAVKVDDVVDDTSVFRDGKTWPGVSCVVVDDELFFFFSENVMPMRDNVNPVTF